MYIFRCYECTNFREKEQYILQDTIIQNNSIETVKLSDSFNYNQLQTIIKNI